MSDVEQHDQLVALKGHANQWGGSAEPPTGVHLDGQQSEKHPESPNEVSSYRDHETLIWKALVSSLAPNLQTLEKAFFKEVHKEEGREGTVKKG